MDGIFHLGYYTLDNATRTDDEDQYAEAADLFREAISLDPEYEEAYYYMGFLFENGLGVDRDMKTAFRFYRKAGDLDHAKSWTKLGTFYAKGNIIVNKNIEIYEALVSQKIPKILLLLMKEELNLEMMKL